MAKQEKLTKTQTVVKTTKNENTELQKETAEEQTVMGKIGHILTTAGIFVAIIIAIVIYCLDKIDKLEKEVLNCNNTVQLLEKNLFEKQQKIESLEKDLFNDQNTRKSLENQLENCKKEISTKKVGGDDRSIPISGSVTSSIVNSGTIKSNQNKDE